MKAQLILDIEVDVGEGALWHPDEQRLYWIDVEKGHLHLYDPALESLRTIALGQRIGTVVPASPGTALVALQDGIYHLNLTSEKLRLLHPLEDEHLRFNDGKCDPTGRLWVGTMHLQEAPGVAALYVLRKDNTFRQVRDGISVSNGITWSPDGQTMYYIDTPTRQVQAFDFDAPTGQISHPRTVVTLPEGSGVPDGMTIDAEGKLWVAHYGGGQVGRWDPHTGELLQRVVVPVPNVTSCAFGDPRLNTLYITTARSSDNPPETAQHPTAGGLFAVRPGVVGLPASFYRGIISADTIHLYKSKI